MKKVTIFFAVIAVFVLSSCNRGVGCPSDFSIQEVGDLISKLLF